MKLIRNFLVLGILSTTFLMVTPTRSYAFLGISWSDFACDVVGGPLAVAACRAAAGGENLACQAVAAVTGLYLCLDEEEREALIDAGCQVVSSLSDDYVYCDSENPLNDDLQECQEDLDLVRDLSDNCEGAWGALFDVYMECRQESSDYRQEYESARSRLHQICEESNDPTIREIAGCVDPLSTHLVTHGNLTGSEALTNQIEAHRIVDKKSDDK